MSHTRKECEHGRLISQCRCIHYGGKPVEVVRPCPFGDDHLRLAVVHPLPATAAASEGVQLPPGAPGTPGPVSLDPPGAHSGAEGVGPRAVKLCVFRSCDWTIEEPANLFAVAAMDAEIRVHLRTHRVEIELMAGYLR